MSTLPGTFLVRRDRLWAAIALSGLLVGCGGGGSRPEVPRFERITMSSIAAVRDNVTGIVWARQLGACPVGSPSGAGDPAALELTQLADLGESALRPFFAFVLDAESPQQIKARESVNSVSPARVWAVDFGVAALGGLSDQASGDTDVNDWCVLSRSSAVPTISYPATPAINGTVTAGGLIWKVCTEGSTWNWTGDISTSTCTGTPTKVKSSAAQVLADAANTARFGGATGWRLPTKNELSALLQLENDLSTQTLLPGAFGVDSLGSVPVYWSSTRSAYNQQVWTVDFSGSVDPGGVVRAPETDDAYVRLVRTAP